MFLMLSDISFPECFRLSLQIFKLRIGKQARFGLQWSLETLHVSKKLQRLSTNLTDSLLSGVDGMCVVYKYLAHDATETPKQRQTSHIDKAQLLLSWWNLTQSNIWKKAKDLNQQTSRSYMAYFPSQKGDHSRMTISQYSIQSDWSVFWLLVVAFPIYFLFSVCALIGSVVTDVNRS